jgi:hypothetical protein
MQLFGFLPVPAVRNASLKKNINLEEKKMIVFSQTQFADKW